MLSYEEFQKQRQAGKSIEQIAAESFSRVKTGTNPQTSWKPGRTAPYGRKTSAAANTSSPSPETTWQKSALDKWLRGDAQYTALTPDALTSLAVQQKNSAIGRPH